MLCIVAQVSVLFGTHLAERQGRPKRASMAETTTNFRVLRHTLRPGANDRQTAPPRRNEAGDAAVPDMNGAEASEAAGTPLQRLSASPRGSRASQPDGSALVLTEQFGYRGHNTSWTNHGLGSCAASITYASFFTLRSVGFPYLCHTRTRHR